MASEQTTESSSLSRRPSILVADDEPRLLKTLADLLRSRGFEVSEAHGGRQACEQLHRQAFDLALLDLNMPELDGFQVMAETGRLQPDCGVIVVSGESSFSTVSRALRRGALDYIRKPFDPEELLATVEGVLGKQSLIRAHEMVQSRLEKSEALHRYIVNSSPDIVFMLDETGHICFINNKVESLLGYQPSELCGQHFRHILDDRDVARGTYALQGPNISADNPRVLEVRLKTRGSRKATRHFEITAFPVDPQTWPQTGKTQGGCTGQPARYYGIARDVTERKEAEAFINFQAYHDLLTRLPNRALFKDRLELAITHARRSQQKLAVMFLDLDRFKVVNDTLGHAMGDRLLQAVTHRLEKCLRRGDTLSRFGGDEFTLLLPSIHGNDDARNIARKLINALKAPFQLGDHEVFVGVSIGISVFPEAGETMDLLIQNADIAMYHVKARGKDGYRFYSDSMSINTANRLSLERDLRLALERNELRVFYQPQVCSRSNRVVGLEALVRWQHPERGLLYPGDFLPLAEETRLVGKLSEQVIDQACRDVGRWISSGHSDLRLAVNLSPSQVEHPRFVETLMNRVAAHNFPADNLEIEITENVIMNDLEQISRKLKELAATGVRIAIDDFGTGYSSLNYLHRLPIHTLKVDQSFVKAIRSGEDGACIVNAIIAMAHGLKLEIVAEGVETDDQLAYLKSLGCHQVQGFFYGPARPAADITRLLAKDGLAFAYTG
ncbi:putative bifunctional diguanylate cyclase/phosphodiesterase [Marinobacter nauticus]|jgi:diguanylate cyclase (GGDEF)-like protein/PAS domain S-box-containing protein|uniref:cyclic-guanylate-specific phosphodiesterase n=2 Tax=Marinobacter TaxID=2742 RepID=A0A368Y598_MARNT|nr:EAL domain-containing protein [Marinobacter nauticus]MBY5938380.1 EAL domain-containing protein [Marinobacter nauticus]MBY5955609.1 EAL domain-containing protein [Marinobacter nauticus]MBY6009400.1 EAL domain-containing protein [Marinobacter nauticus]MBY6220754.1 EAL domain-containing protein [Marinobacter nauticus]RCW75372.1 PAS domain S-box-containing protein/diguanylate cyclase (GGDEF)-like protein [Marinobacter nauticus]